MYYVDIISVFVMANDYKWLFDEFVVAIKPIFPGRYPVVQDELFVSLNS